MGITEKTRAEVGEALKKSLDRADAAMESRNYGYACQILHEILRAEPGLNEARLNLRQAQLEQIGFTGNRLRGLVATLKNLFAIYYAGPAQLKKGNFGKALEIAEKAMANDPALLSSLSFLARAASAAGLKEIAVNAMEIAVRFHPKSVAALRGLAESYQEAGEATKAVSMWQKVRELQPNNLTVTNELKRATALAAMESGGWQEAGSFKDVMKDKDKAEDLEHEERLVVRDPEARKRMIDKTRQAIEATPDRPGLHKRLASLLQQNHDFEEAIAAYNKVMDLTGAYDPGIDAQISDILRTQYNQRIDQAKTAGKNQAEIELLIRERDEKLLERLQQRVSNFPTELNFRFELGTLLWQLNRVDDALEEFQQTQKAAHLAQKSRLFMGKCFNRKELYDLAVEHFEMALEDSDRLSSADYKECLYECAIAYEKGGKLDKAQEKFKELYSTDVKYRDVAERMERFYRGG